MKPKNAFFNEIGQRLIYLERKHGVIKKVFWDRCKRIINFSRFKTTGCPHLFNSDLPSTKRNLEIEKCWPLDVSKNWILKEKVSIRCNTFCPKQTKNKCWNKTCFKHVPRLKHWTVPADAKTTRGPFHKRFCTGEDTVPRKNLMAWTNFNFITWIWLATRQKLAWIKC